MKRRAFIGTLAIVPAASATALAQPPAAAPQPATPPPNTQAPSPTGPGAAPPPPPGLPDPLTYASADEAGVTVTRYFTAAQFAALDRLARLFIPSAAGTPGAADAGAARFLDFYVGKSPVERQTLYKSGLDGLNTRAKKRFSKTFGETDDTQADAIVMEFLGRPWSYAPSDPLEAFLRTALRDVRRATQNSTAASTAQSTQSAPPQMVNWLRPL